MRISFMKRITAIFAVFSLALLLVSSCHDKPNLIADYKDVTISYGVLNINDDIHYFKIYRGFITEDNVKRADGKDEFYDLLIDPLEETNVIDDPAYAEQIQRMKFEMLDWYQKTCDIVPRIIDNRIGYKQAQAMTEGLPERVRKQIMKEYRDGLGGMGLALKVRAEKAKLAEK